MANIAKITRFAFFCLLAIAFVIFLACFFSVQNKNTMGIVNVNPDGMAYSPIIRTSLLNQNLDKPNISSQIPPTSNSSHFENPPEVKIIGKKFGQTRREESETSSSDRPKGNGRKGEQTCPFPDLPIDSPSITQFLKDPAPLECSKVEKNWVYAKNGTFLIDRQAEIKCNYTNFWRVNDDKVEMKTVIDFKSGSDLEGDFFKVDCKSDSDGSSYSNVHATVVPVKTALERTKQEKPPDDWLNLNVYMAGFDSLSRLMFIRKLPKLYKYLTETMGAIVLEGYNIVGDGTPQALIPMFTGKTEEELPLTRKRYPNASYVNVYPFVWNEYRNAGYLTLYGEDAASIGTFTYRLRGFNDQPTDHYMRTFYMIAEQEKKHKWQCWGSEEAHKTHFDYVQHFWDSYPNEIRKFAFQFHAGLSHDDLNKVTLADDYLIQHMKYFMDNGHLNDTILIVMADHGHRYAGLRATQQGKLEERLPFFSLIFPPWFKEKYPDSYRTFKTNARRLTTPFDIHATLREILHFDSNPKIGNLTQRSLSLFHEIPIERTCADAGVEPHWCSCLDWKEVSVLADIVQHMANQLVGAINNETEREHELCGRLNLSKIEKAVKYTPQSDLTKFKRSKDRDGFVPDLTANSTVQVEYYQMDFWTTPGDAHYEARVSWDKRSNILTIHLDLISHVNRFGDLPHCVIDKDYFLAKWCVCFDKI